MLLLSSQGVAEVQTPTDPDIQLLFILFLQCSKLFKMGFRIKHKFNIIHKIINIFMIRKTDCFQSFIDCLCKNHYLPVLPLNLRKNKGCAYGSPALIFCPSLSFLRSVNPPGFPANHLLDCRYGPQYPKTEQFWAIQNCSAYKYIISIIQYQCLPGVTALCGVSKMHSISSSPVLRTVAPVPFMVVSDFKQIRASHLPDPLLSQSSAYLHGPASSSDLHSSLSQLHFVSGRISSTNA